VDARIRTAYEAGGVLYQGIRFGRDQADVQGNHQLLAKE